MTKDGDVIILHLSDLHASEANNFASTVWGHLRNDVQHGYRETNDSFEHTSPDPRLPDPSQIDLVIVSGDLTRHAKPNEYAQAAALLNSIARGFLGRDRGRVIVAPGNHDIDWGSTEKAYTKVASPTGDLLTNAKKESSPYRIGPGPQLLQSTLFVRSDEKAYARRLSPFGDFFTKYYEKRDTGSDAQRNTRLDWGPDARRPTFNHNDEASQYSIYDSFAPDLGVVVVAFNSCYRADHLWHRGSILTDAILRASAELDRMDPSQSYLRIAVWHHNILGSPLESDFMDPRIAILLSQHGFSLGLHGHVHQGGRLDLLGTHARMPVVWAGSLASDARPQSVPLLYNIIGVRRGASNAWVHVRSRDNDLDSWTACTTWGSKHRPWYKVPLSGRGGRSPSDGPLVYKDVADASFHQRLEHLICSSREVIFIGGGLNVLMGAARDLVLERTRAGKLDAIICYGNPFSEHMRARMTEEERGTIRPEVRAEGIRNRVISMVEAAGAIPKLKVLLFNNYPTLSVFRFDNQYVYYPMGYRRLGNNCPVTFVERDSTLGRFLDGVVQDLINDAVDAAEVLRARQDHTLHFLRPEEIAELAIYVIPGRQTKLYELGSWLVGYDILGGGAPREPGPRPRDRRAKELKVLVGASEYGFHLTVADVMYVPRNQVDILRCELQAIASSAASFDLTIDSAETGVGQERSVVLTATDPSGQLERLAAEIAVRFRPKGLGTRYTLEPQIRATLGRLSKRDHLMLDAYASPHVFTRYRPHFTVLVSLPGPPEQLERLCKKVKDVFEDCLGEANAVNVEELYLLTRPVGARGWDPITPERVIHLGGGI